ncbi:hypothetical protein ACXZ66_03695 [Corynebacterium sp. S7]
MASISDKAARLFKYLAERQRSDEDVVFQTSEYLTKGGAILRLGSLFSSNDSNGWVRFSEHVHNESTRSDDYVVSFHRPVHPDFPQVSGELAPWISKDRFDPDQRPRVLEMSSVDDGPSSSLASRRNRDIEDWLEQWDIWAASAKHHNLYQKALKLHTRAIRKLDDFVLVLGLGSLGWKFDEDRVINKHLYTIVLHSELDETSGTVTFRVGDSNLLPDFAALASEKLLSNSFHQAIGQELEKFDGKVLEESSFTRLGQVTAYELRSDATYTPNRTNLSPTKIPTLCWDPAIILRPRNDSVLSTAFEEIANEISATGKAPAGIVELFNLLQPDPIDADRPIPGAPKIKFDIPEIRPLSLRQEQPPNPSPVASTNGKVFSYSEPSAPKTAPKTTKKKGHSLTSPYVQFDGSTIPVAEASNFQLETGILEILKREGPMTGGLLRSRYVKSSGIPFVNKQLASPLNRVINRMLNSGAIRVIGNDFRNGYTDRTFYLPKTPPVVLRERGPRLLGEIPIEEVRGLMREVFKKTGIDDRTELMQRTLNEFGFVNLTEAAFRMLQEPYSHIMREAQK